MKRWFITGTDTGVGKTYAACALIRHLVSQGQQVAAMKPLASGCIKTPEGLRNEDALAMMDAMNVDLSYQQVNPYAYEPAIAPHIAAQQVCRPVDIGRIVRLAGQIRADHLVIEGAGGWCVPLNERQMFPELVKALGAEVVLVVGMKLGCINHSLLTSKQVGRDSCPLKGWIANEIDDGMPVYGENLETLSKLMPAPMLCEIRWQEKSPRLSHVKW